RQLLVISAESRVESTVVFEDRGFDFVEAVSAIHIPNDAECALAPRLVRRKNVAHPARWVHLFCHDVYSFTLSVTPYRSTRRRVASRSARSGSMPLRFADLTSASIASPMVSSSIAPSAGAL